MKALVIGASGLVGSALMRALGPDAVGTYRSRPVPGLVPLDAADREAVAHVIDGAQSDLVLFPAAEPHVDWCEQHPEEARERNLGPLRTTCAAAEGIPLVAFSSDYVFDGRAGPYHEGDERRPLSVYGCIKTELEDVVLARGGCVVRTTTVFGDEPPPGKNFVLRLVASLQRGEPILVPNDQVSTPTYADDLARAVVRIATQPAGIWHVVGPELMARAEFARRIAAYLGLETSLVQGVSTSVLRQPAARPLRGGLRCDRFEATFGRLPGRTLDETLRDLATRLGWTPASA